MRYFLLLLLLLISATLLPQNINISGENTATFIHRTAKDSLNNYFENELRFRVDRGVFSFGMSFIADLPKYDDTDPMKELRTDKLEANWTDIFVQVNHDDFRLRAGTIEESYGVGLMLRSWNNKDLNKDKRLDGALAHYSFQDLRIKGLYGKMKEDSPEDAISENDLVAAVDVEYRPFTYLTVGTSAVEYKQNRNNEYTYMNLYGGRIGINTDYFDIDTEYAEIKTFHGIPTQYGNAFYTHANTYLGSWSLSAGYKRYDNFDRYPLSDLPTLNHYDELLYSFDSNVKIEEGLQGEIRYNHHLEHEISVNYGESWDKGFNVRHSNLFTEYKWHLDALSITADYEQLEKKSEFALSLEKERTPSVTVEFVELPVPLSIKTKWAFKDEKIDETQKSNNKPYLQIDSRAFGILSYSVFGEYKFVGMDDLTNNRVFLGAELVTNIARHTEVKLFVGSESGGKVCRNGVCKDQAPFEGIKLSLNTRF